MLELGQIRNQSEGKIQFPRHQFSDDDNERAYLLGLRAGDVNAWRKSPNTVEARVSTTHPAMSRLFSGVFGKYGHLMLRAEPAYLPGVCRWQMRVHLDPSFDFLVRKPRSVPRGSDEFFHFLAGYSDSECCWCLYAGRGRTRISWTIESNDVELLNLIWMRLRTNGLHPSLYQVRQRTTRPFRKNHVPALRQESARTLRLMVFRTNEVLALAEKLLPMSRHAEKVSKIRLILESRHLIWPQMNARLRRLRRRIRTEVDEYVEEAERAYNVARQPRGLGVVG